MDVESFTKNYAIPLSHIPKYDPNIVKINPISGGLEGGVSNYNYKISLSDQKYFMRVSCGDAALLGIDRPAEVVALQYTSEAGIAPPIIYFDSQAKVIITQFIESEPNPFTLKDEQKVQAFISSLKRLHELDVQLPIVFSPYQTLKKYYLQLLELNHSFPIEFYEVVLPFCDKIEAKLGPFKELCPCHLDLHPGNLLYDGNKTWLIDWEYAAMADPLFDIAVMSSTCFYSSEDRIKLLECYLGRSALTAEIDRLNQMTVLASVRWYLWCEIQAKISQLGFDYHYFGECYLNHLLIQIKEMDVP